MKILSILFFLLPVLAISQEAKPQHLELPSLPHLRLNLEKRCVEVEAEVCLHQGILELIACTKGTKEHEAIVATKALPKHIHLMLVLLGAQPGNPHDRAPLDESRERWREVPARGQPISVHLGFTNEEGDQVERPIAYFIRSKSGEEPELGHFLFAGSKVVNRDSERTSYLADHSGHLITLSSFGDETLCLPQRYSHSNQFLHWEVKPRDLPAPGEPVTLILKPLASGVAAKPESP